MSNEALKRTKSTLAGMKQRCYNPKCSQFKNYGGRGIKVCNRWLESFQNFVEDMGLKPETYRRNLEKAGALILAEIERIDRQPSRA